MVGRSEASKKGDSTGWMAGGVAKSMFIIRLEPSVASFVESSFPPASGDEIFGACLLVDVVFEASLACRTGKRPLVGGTVTCFALPALRKEVLGDSPWDGMTIWGPLPLPLSCGDGGPLLLLPESEVVEGVDLTDTIRGASRAAAVAGMGCADASSMNISELMESRIKDGEMEAMV